MLWQFFSHSIQTLIYIVYVSVVGLAVERIVSAPLPAELGGTNPFAHVLMMGGVAIAALMLLRHIRTDVAGGPAGSGLLRQAASVAVGMGMTAALGGAGTAAAQGIRGLRRRSGLQRDQAPWERMDAEAGAASVHGAPQTGFEPVPAMGGAWEMRAGRREIGGSRVEGERGRGGDRAAATAELSATAGHPMPSSPPGVAPMSDAHSSGVDSARSGEQPAVQRISGVERAALTSGDERPALTSADEPPAVPATVEDRARDAVPASEAPTGDEPFPADDDGIPPEKPPTAAHPGM